MSSFTSVVALTDFDPNTTAESAQVDANFAAIRDVVNALVTGSNAINADTIAEVTSAGGVTIDGLLVKDAGIAAPILTGTIRATSVVVGIPASTTQTQGQGPLTGVFNQVSVCANANDTVTLPSANTGTLCVIRNDGAQTLRVYPASAAAINGLGTNNPTTIAAGATASFWASSATQWYTW